MQDQGQAERAIEPIGGLFDGPAGAIAARARSFDRDAFPTAGEGGMPFVEMSRDSVAGGLGPVAQPASRFDGAGRQRQKRGFYGGFNLSRMVDGLRFFDREGHAAPLLGLQAAGRAVRQMDHHSFAVGCERLDLERGSLAIRAGLHGQVQGTKRR